MSQQEADNLIVKRGIAIGAVITPLLFLILYFLLPKFDQQLPLPERLQLGLECLVFPAVFLLVTILKVGSQRFGNTAEDPTVLEASTKSMAVDIRVLGNTHEQIAIFGINTMALSVLLPFEYLSLVPIYSGMFVFGRAVFWLSYRHNILWRAPGFAMCVFPAVVGLAYCGGAILLRLFTG